MTAEILEILKRLDFERRSTDEASLQGDVVRESSLDGSECLIVYSHCATTREVDEVIRKEISLAQERKYILEWKVYDHDTPLDLKDHLLAAGFEPAPIESLMVLPVKVETLPAFAAPAYDLKHIDDSAGLDDVAAISREIGRTNVDDEKRRLALTLRDVPDQMSVYVAYIDGEAVACGRIHFKENSQFAELCGGRTKTTRRNRGLYTGLVAARLKEALERNRKYIVVDALPASEPILRKRGFQFVTHTQPYVYRPRS
ncbi:MAG: GNAT family N-acetyltransferase [Candidatus Binataceae bacterium]